LVVAQQLLLLSRTQAVTRCQVTPVQLLTTQKSICVTLGYTADCFPLSFEVSCKQNSCPLKLHLAS
jgi:hypothetical protein